MLLTALVRGVAPSIVNCELTFLEREPIDHGRALAQHAAYRRFLEGCGASVLELPTDPALPDCCFVEDTAVVLGDVAVITRPGAASRRGETAAIEEALAARRRLERIEQPGTLEGGDVLVMGRRIFVGRTARTNDAGIAALARIAKPLGYDTIAVEVHGCLHLKSAVAGIDDETVVTQPAWIDTAPFTRLRQLPVAEGESWAANVRRIGPVVGVHTAFPRTAEIIAKHAEVRSVDISEFLKAEAGMTCLSVLLGEE
jgi:dimethylargininase